MFERDGFAVMPGFVTDSSCNTLRTRALEIVEASDMRGASTFNTRHDAAARDAYFLESANTVRCFFEEEARDERGDARVAKALAINKIGHALHELDPVFARFSHDPRLHELLIGLGVREPRIYQSMYIFKQPHIGGEVDWHQDATFFSTEPQSVITLWFAIERATITNGCLRVLRGGHHTPLRERFEAVPGGGTRMVRLDSTPWPSGSAGEPLEVEAGTLVVMHGLLPHYSAPNRSAHSRHAYTLHAVDGRARYDPRNWLQRPAGFSGVASSGST
jgi:phytanoyl-CoA hydroxylase